MGNPTHHNILARNIARLQDLEVPADVKSLKEMRAFAATLKHILECLHTVFDIGLHSTPSGWFIRVVADTASAGPHWESPCLWDVILTECRRLQKVCVIPPNGFLGFAAAHSASGDGQGEGERD